MSHQLKKVPFHTSHDVAEPLVSPGVALSQDRVITTFRSRIYAVEDACQELLEYETRHKDISTDPQISSEVIRLHRAASERYAALRIDVANMNAALGPNHPVIAELGRLDIMPLKGGACYSLREIIGGCERLHDVLGAITTFSAAAVSQKHMKRGPRDPEKVERIQLWSANPLLSNRDFCALLDRKKRPLPRNIQDEAIDRTWLGALKYRITKQKTQELLSKEKRQARKG